MEVLRTLWLSIESKSSQVTSEAAEFNLILNFSLKYHALFQI